MQKFGFSPVIQKGKIPSKKNKKIYNHLTGLYFFQKYVELTIDKVYIHVFYTNKNAFATWKSFSENY